VVPGGNWTFSGLPWSPTATYRYSRFSEHFDPLFYGLSRGYGTWFQGEVAANYAGPFNSSQSIMWRSRPSPVSLTVGALYFGFDPLSTDKGNLGGRLYLEWMVNEHWLISPLVGFYKPERNADNGGGATGQPGLPGPICSWWSGPSSDCRSWGCAAAFRGTRPLLQVLAVPVGTAGPRHTAATIQDTPVPATTAAPSSAAVQTDRATTPAATAQPSTNHRRQLNPLQVPHPQRLVCRHHHLGLLHEAIAQHRPTLHRTALQAAAMDRLRIRPRAARSQNAPVARDCSWA
jgi:hypothetical protein